MPDALTNNKRIALLVIALAVLSAVPLFGLLLTFNSYWMPASWAITSVTIGVMQVLSFWVGMGNQHALARFAWGAAGAAYISFWPELAYSIEFASSMPDEITLPWEEQITPMLMSVASVTAAGLALLVIRRWWIVRLATESGRGLPAKPQFSVYNLLFLMAGIAVLLAGVRASREAVREESDSVLVIGALILSILLFNTVSGAFASLSGTAVGRNCAVALLTSLLLGVAISFAMGQDHNGWWSVAGNSLLGVVPTSIVIASLLVVRSAGYRLVRKSSIGAQFDNRTDERASIGTN